MMELGQVTDGLLTPNTQLTDFNEDSQKNDIFLSQNTQRISSKPKDQYDLELEEDLSDESSLGQVEPTVEKYMPDIFIDVDLSKRGTPAIVDFYDECLEKYRHESEFIRDEIYLAAPSKGWVVKDTENSATASVSDDANKILFDDSHDVWNICKPHDPLLRCIHSISDRLRIQQLVADPSSYLKRGGDDNHYDIDDPFFDDSDMYTQLNIDKAHVIINQEILQNFSPWSEDGSCLESVLTEGLKGVSLNPNNFIAVFQQAIESTKVKQPEIIDSPPKASPVKLFVNSNGWKKYIRRIPPKLQQPFKEFVTKWNNIVTNASTRIATRTIKDAIDELLNNLFKKMLTLPIKSILPPKEPTNAKACKDSKVGAIKSEVSIKNEPDSFNSLNKIENQECLKEEILKSPIKAAPCEIKLIFPSEVSSPKLDLENQFCANIIDNSDTNAKEKDEGVCKKKNKSKRSKNVHQKPEFIDFYDGNIVLPGKLIDSCNKTLRWLTCACKSITNAYSLVDFAVIWLKMTLDHNKQTLLNLEQKISDKLEEGLHKLHLEGCKKFETFRSALESAGKHVLTALRKEGFGKKYSGNGDNYAHLRIIEKYLRTVSRDLITFIQLANLSSSVTSSIATSQLADQMAKDLLLDINPYEILAKVVSNYFNKVLGKPICLPWQLLYAVVRHYQKSSKTRSLYEHRQKPTVLLMDYSVVSAPANSTIDIREKKGNKSLNGVNKTSSKSVSVAGKKLTNGAPDKISGDKRKIEGVSRNKQENATKKSCSRVKPAASMKDLLMGKLCPTN